jgi:hypothetical protein
MRGAIPPLPSTSSWREAQGQLYVFNFNRVNSTYLVKHSVIGIGRNANVMRTYILFHKTEVKIIIMKLKYKNHK